MVDPAGDMHRVDKRARDEHRGRLAAGEMTPALLEPIGRLGS